MLPVILSGGSGTRLWPVSRKKIPKQFAEIFNDSLQDMTFQRCSQINPCWLMTSEALRVLTEASLKKLKAEDTPVIYEPVGKNTAPAIAVLCHLMKLRGHENEVVGIFPSDHLVTKTHRFEAVTRLAEDVAKNQVVVTLGLEPDYPETGYGYIQTQKPIIMEKEGHSAHSVEKFHEKPNLETAQKFLSEGNYFWNSGIFVFKVSHMIQLFQKSQPKIWALASTLKNDLSNIKEVYDLMPNISMDYAIIEKLSASELACIPCDLGWSDVGSWDAVAQYYEKKGQIQKGSPHKVLSVDSNGNFVFGQDNRHYAFVGVDDVILVDTPDATLIVKKGQSQKVKDIVDILNNEKSKLAIEHVYEHRPWGNFEILRDNSVFKSKIIQVHPHQQLSYQSHNQREEHWIITRGHGEVVLNDKTILVKAGSHVHIPTGAKHRMRNTSTDLLEFVEVQLGSYFGEDDIIRYQDDYGRSL